MSVNWADERYVRLYTRDSADWLCLSVLAQGLFCLILRKVDRAGVLELGKAGRRGVAIAIGFPGEWARLEPALEELVSDGCVSITGDRLVVPNFLEAQEAEASDKARSKAYRERRRDLAKAGVTREEEKQNTVAEASRTVANRHAGAQLRDDPDTPRDACDTARIATVTPSLAVPNQPSEEATTPDAAAGRSSLRVVDAPQSSHPLVAAFRSGLADRLAVPADWFRVASADRVQEVRDTLERELTRVGLQPALDACVAAALREVSGGRKKPRYMSWYSTVVADLTPAGVVPPNGGPARKFFVGFAEDGFTPIYREAK